MLSYTVSSSFWTLPRVRSKGLCRVNRVELSVLDNVFIFPFRKDISSLSLVFWNYDFPLLSSIQHYYYEICCFFEVMVSYFFPEDFRIFCITDFLNITLTCLAVEIFVSILFRFSYLLFEFGELEGNIFLYISPHSPYMLVNSFLLGLLLNTYGHFNVCLYFLMFPSFFLSLNPFLMQVLRLPQAYLATW